MCYSCYSVLQCVADLIWRLCLAHRCVCCSQCVAVHCSVLYCVVVCCSMLQCVADLIWRLCLARRSVCCSQCVAVRCSTLCCVAVCCSMLQYVTVCCGSDVASYVWSSSFSVVLSFSLCLPLVCVRTSSPTLFLSVMLSHIRAHTHYLSLFPSPPTPPPLPPSLVLCRFPILPPSVSHTHSCMSIPRRLFFLYSLCLYRDFFLGMSIYTGDSYEGEYCEDFKHGYVTPLLPHTLSKTWGVCVYVHTRGLETREQCPYSSFQTLTMIGLFWHMISLFWHTFCLP